MPGEAVRSLIGSAIAIWSGNAPLDIAPPVPTVGLSAVAIGGLCCGVLVIIAIAVAVILTIRKKNKAEKEDPS